MGAQYLIDSNAVIDYLSGKLPPDGMAFMHDIINAVPKVSVITQIEVLGYNAPPEDEQLLIDFMADAEIFGITNAVVNQSIGLRKQLKIKLPDAIIAATALVYEWKLVSRNTGDFKGISGLTVIDPYGI